MDGYARLQGAALRGGGGAYNLRIHGAAQLFVTRADCATACSASVDCTGFVVHREKARASFCTFKRLGALAAARLGPAINKDTYIKKKTSATDDQQPRMRWSPEPDLLLNISSLAAAMPSASAGPRVLAVNGLLSEQDARALRDFAMDCFRRERHSRGGTAVTTSASATTEKVIIGQNVECPASSVAGILSQLEMRISGLTGMALHEEEEPLLLTRQRPKGPYGPWLDGSSLHHDRMSLKGIEALRGQAGERELRVTSRREATILTYLTGVDEGKGGHTIFPTLSPQGKNLPRRLDDDGSALRLEAFAATVQAAFEGGVRSLGHSLAEPLCSVAQQAAAEPLPPQVSEAREAVRRHAEAECERALRNASEGLAVRPQAALSIAFWHTRHAPAPADASGQEQLKAPAGTAQAILKAILTHGDDDDPRVWHAGCVGRSSPGRLALQKFKTPPTEKAAAALRAAWAADAGAEPAALRAWARHGTKARGEVPVGRDAYAGGKHMRSRGRLAYAWPQEDEDNQAAWEEDGMEDLLARAEHAMYVVPVPLRCGPSPSPLGSTSDFPCHSPAPTAHTSGGRALLGFFIQVSTPLHTAH